MDEIEEKIAQASENYGNTCLNRCRFNDERMRQFDTYDIETAFEQGAEWALSHQWQSVDEDGLPKSNDDTLVSYTDHIMGNECVGIANYDDIDGKWYSADDEIYLSRHSIKFWMPIPQLPQARMEDENTNTNEEYAPRK